MFRSGLTPVTYEKGFASAMPWRSRRRRAASWHTGAIATRGSRCNRASVGAGAVLCAAQTLTRGTPSWFATAQPITAKVSWMMTPGRSAATSRATASAQ